MQFDGSTLTTVFGPSWRLLLIGAGQLSQAVAQMAALLDFEVMVCDPREEYAATLVAGMPSVQRLEGMPDDVVRDLQPDAHTAIVALTHDPKLDDLALMRRSSPTAEIAVSIVAELVQVKHALTGPLAHAPTGGLS